MVKLLIVRDCAPSSCCLVRCAGRCNIIASHKLVLCHSNERQAKRLRSQNIIHSWENTIPLFFCNWQPKRPVPNTFKLLLTPDSGKD